MKEMGCIMKVFDSFENGKLTLTLVGELDHHSARITMKKLDRFIEEYMPRDCALDFFDLSFMDSSGIAVILRVHKMMKETGGRAWVENPRNQPLRVIDASGIERIVRISTATGGKMPK